MQGLESLWSHKLKNKAESLEKWICGEAVQIGLFLCYSQILSQGPLSLWVEHFKGIQNGLFCIGACF